MGKKSGFRIYKDSKTGHYHIDLRKIGAGRPSLETDKKSVAQEIADHIWLQHLEGKFDVKLLRNREEMTIGQAVEEFKKIMKPRMKEKTYRNYGYYCKNILSFFNEKCLLSAITHKDVTDFISKRYEDGVKPSTINADLKVLKSIFQKMINEEKIQKNPVLVDDFIPENNKLEKAPSREEVKKLLEMCKLDYLVLAIKISIYTGMRKGEILSLELPGVDVQKFSRKAIDEKRNWVDLKNKLFILNNTKNNIPRKIPINEELLNDLKKYVGDRIEGRIYQIKDFRKAFEILRRKAELPDIDFHYLRHFFISECAMNGYNREMVQEIAGQVSEEVYKRYCHINLESKKKLIKEIGSILAVNPKLILYKAYYGLLLLLS